MPASMSALRSIRFLPVGGKRLPRAYQRTPVESNCFSINGFFAQAGALSFVATMLFDHRSRPLFAALCLSLLLHLLVLFGDSLARPLPTEGHVPEVPLRLQIRAATPVTGAVVSAASEVPTPRSPAANGRYKQTFSRQAVAVPPPVALPPPVSSLLPPTTSVSGDASGVAEAASASAAGVVTPSGASADGLRQYRIDLAGAARRYRSYPALARNRGWQGVVELSVSIGPPGVPSVQLNRSSGHGLLDEQALDMLSRAVAETPLPDSLRGGKFSVMIPIRFSLEE